MQESELGHCDSKAYKIYRQFDKVSLAHTGKDIDKAGNWKGGREGEGEGGNYEGAILIFLLTPPLISCNFD